MKTEKIIILVLKNMDSLRCTKTINIQRHSGVEKGFTLPKPVLIAPSPKERTVLSPTPKSISSLNVDFLGDIGLKMPSTQEYSDKEFYKYIYSLLATFIEKDKISTILGKDTISFWRTCFTHVSYDPNYDKNYETLESVGDKILSYTFKTYLYSRYPDISASQLNNLDQHYMSTHLQALVSSKMGLTNWLRVNGEVPKTSEKIREDLLEAFFGTIDTIFNKKFGIGYGVKTCMKFIEKLFDFELNKDIEPSKTFVFQIFERLGIKQGITNTIEQVVINGEISGWESVITINEFGLQTFKNNGKDLGMTPKTWTIRRMTKKPTEQAAFTEVMYYLLNNGISAKWVQTVKRDSVIDTQIGKESYDLVLNKAKRINREITSVDIQETYKSKPAKTVFQIIGVTPSGKVILESHSSHQDKVEGFAFIIDKFLRK